MSGLNQNRKFVGNPYTLYILVILRFLAIIYDEANVSMTEEHRSKGVSRDYSYGRLNMADTKDR